ncbi:hypothetical protein I7I53_02973 [Histoplasma capsulatum var. duboisii H88]|uniref:Uncharacterized protein n=1 Tax=Ajellomyces capsulatus (strain H88) TaxID=544711 RepID=A0A8A1LMJ0_AJEC8|nr:hypothetical protein I7I53_02973 [Histoplasma capsulatum var. duboisii H88]
MGQKINDNPFYQHNHLFITIERMKHAHAHAHARFSPTVHSLPELQLPETRPRLLFLRGIRLLLLSLSLSVSFSQSTGTSASLFRTLAIFPFRGGSTTKGQQLTSRKVKLGAHNMATNRLQLTMDDIFWPRLGILQIMQIHPEHLDLAFIDDVMLRRRQRRVDFHLQHAFQFGDLVHGVLLQRLLCSDSRLDPFPSLSADFLARLILIANLPALIFHLLAVSPFYFFFFFCFCFSFILIFQFIFSRFPLLLLLHLLLLQRQYRRHIRNACSLLVHEDTRAQFFVKELMLLHASLPFLVPFLGFGGVPRALPGEHLVVLRGSDHICGRGKLPLHGELAEKAVGFKAKGGGGEMQGEIRGPHILAQCSGYGLLAVVD